MKHLFMTFFIAGTVSTPFLANAQKAPEPQIPEQTSQEPQEQTTQERRIFLFNLGFEDYSRQIDQRLQKGQFEHELNRRQMQRNSLMYQTINASRELSLLLMADLDQQTLDSSKKASLSEFVAKMLALKPLPPPLNFPSEIMTLPENERNIAAAKWLDAERRKQMENHLRKILSDVSSYIYDSQLENNPEKLKKIYKLLSTIVDRMYLDDVISQTKFFGRSFLALIAREEKTGRLKDSQMLAQISEELKNAHNLHLENFIGDTLVLDGKKGPQKIKVENGMQLLTRNLSAESLTISIAAIPDNLFLRWKARFKGLVGNPLASPFFVTAEDTKEGISLWTRVRDQIAQGDLKIQTGLSHIVYYEVKEDVKTGIKMPRVIHNYPNPVADHTQNYANTGGVTITYSEQVIDRSHHSQVYVAKVNPEKYHTAAMEHVRKNGFNPEFFKDSIQLELQDGTPVKSENSQSKPWKIAITQSEFEKMHAEKDAQKWSQKVMQRFTDKLVDFSLRGVTFHWPDPYDFYIVDSAYCSQTGEMAMQEAANIPLEIHKSSWHWGLRFLAKIGYLAERMEKIKGLEGVAKKLKAFPNVEKAMKITKIKIIAPSNLAVQNYMDGGVVALDSKNLEQRFTSPYATYAEKNESLTRGLENTLPRNRSEFDKFSKAFVDSTRSGAVDLRALEYAYVMRASLGLKTDIDIEKVAENAAMKGQIQAGKYKMGAPSCKSVFAR